MSDKYDDAIEYLTKQGGIYNAWNDYDHPAHCLFQYVTPDGTKWRNAVNAGLCGCLTQVKANIAHAYTTELQALIMADDRIASDPSKITLEDLPVYAEWQRRIDRELNRK